jgi:hypothetical protein
MPVKNAHLCTLFEGHYHFGLGAWINSLLHFGFSGTIWVGYRREIPHWISKYKTPNEKDRYSIGNQIEVVFVKQEREVHFTFQKPDFMLTLWEQHCPHAQSLFYFDPDILLKTQWTFFENWVRYGIAICADVSSPMSKTHPIRMAWRHYLSKKGIQLSPKDNYYVNAGFIGISKQNRSFLAEWKSIQDIIILDMTEKIVVGINDRAYLFHMSDQDALNIAKDRTAHPLSIADKPAMDFEPGGFIMSHAIGNPKPWKKNFLKHLLFKGKRPTTADRLFFKYSRFFLDVYSRNSLQYYLRLLNLKIAIYLGRIIGS